MTLAIIIVMVFVLALYVAYPLFRPEPEQPTPDLEMRVAPAWEPKKPHPPGPEPQAPDPQARED